MIILNGEKVNFEKFPNKETRVPKLNDDVVNTIDFKYEDDSDLIKLMLVTKYLGDNAAILRIYYMPYSRMDRSELGSVFTLKYVADFINSLNFYKVIVVEPHSDVTPALLNNSIAIYPTFVLLEEVEEMVGFNREKDFLFFPDAGAQKRYHSLTGYKQLVGYKNRDFQTGKIVSLDVVGNIPKIPLIEEHKSKVIIMDDLSSYGGTFVMSAEKLSEIGFKEIYLLTAHAEDSIFKGNLFTVESKITKMFTTDSILTEHEDNWFTAKHKEKLHVFPMSSILMQPEDYGI